MISTQIQNDVYYLMSQNEFGAMFGAGIAIGGVLTMLILAIAKQSKKEAKEKEELIILRERIRNK